MSSQQSNERKPNQPLSNITLHARQLLRVNTQRAANWFRKPSFPRFKLKFSSPRSRSSPYSHSSSTDNASPASPSIQTSSSTTLHSIRSIRPRSRAPQTTSTYNTRLVRTSPVIVPIMPTVRLFLFTLLEADHYVSFHFIFSSGSSPYIIYHLSTYININSDHGFRGSVHRTISLTFHFPCYRNNFEKSVLDRGIYIYYSHTCFDRRLTEATTMTSVSPICP